MIVRNAAISSEVRALKLPIRLAGASAEAPNNLARESSARPAPGDIARVPPGGETAVEAVTDAQLAAARAIVTRELAANLEALQERARAEGFASGRAEGMEVGRSEALRAHAERTGSALAALSSLVAGTQETMAQESQQLAEVCADIVAEAFRKIAGESLVSREAALGVVREVIRRVKDERELTIRVSPHDLPSLMEQEQQLRQALGSRRWRFEADGRVGAGGCLVESSLGTLDGRLEVQLHELGETLRAAKAQSWEAHGPA